MKIKIRRLRFLGRPRGIGSPGERSALECAGLPVRLCARAMQVISEKRSLDVLAKFAPAVVISKRNNSDALSARALPFAVIPRSCHDEICVSGIVFFRVIKNLPRSPRIFLIPESRHIQIRNRRGVKLTDPSFALPEIVV